MKLLVTGGAGFIGSNFIRHVIGRAEIDLLVNMDCLTYAGNLATLADVASHPKYRFERVDLRAKENVLQTVKKHGITHVVHLAAESHVDRSIVQPGDFVQTNVAGTFNLLEACRDMWSNQNAKHRFVQVSTDEVFGSLGPAGRFNEMSPYAPNSPYAASKAAADLLARAYRQTFGLPSVISICSNNYGPYQFPEKLIPVVILSVLARRPVPVYGDGMNTRDWLHVRDHAEALWLVLTRGRTGETYAIGGNNEWPNLRVVELICDLVDELVPRLGGNSRKLISFVKDRPGHDRRYAIDATKVKTELDWSPTYTFKRGLRDTVKWYLDNQDWVRIVSNH
jgi:dTDP-glucose 4,6-dehydratase